MHQLPSHILINDGDCRDYSIKSGCEGKKKLSLINRPYVACRYFKLKMSLPDTVLNCITFNILLFQTTPSQIKISV